MKFLDSFLKDTPLPLPLRHGETYQDRERIDRLLNSHWNDKRAWLRGSDEEDKHFTYGEVTNLGARQLIELFNLDGEDIRDKEENQRNGDIVFFDLGSGQGKLVVQMILENVATTSVGIELSTLRHSLALQKWQALQQNSLFHHGGQVDPNRIQFVNKNILEADFSKATHIFLSSLCFPEKTIDEIAEVIARNRRQYKKLQTVIALSKLKSLEDENNGAYWKRSFAFIQMTWGMNTAIVYENCGDCI